MPDLRSEMRSNLRFEIPNLTDPDSPEIRDWILPTQDFDEFGDFQIPDPDQIWDFWGSRRSEILRFWTLEIPEFWSKMTKFWPSELVLKKVPKKCLRKGDPQMAKNDPFLSTITYPYQKNWNLTLFGPSRKSQNWTNFWSEFEILKIRKNSEIETQILDFWKFENWDFGFLKIRILKNWKFWIWKNWKILTKKNDENFWWKKLINFLTLFLSRKIEKKSYLKIATSSINSIRIFNTFLISIAMSVASRNS